MTQTPPKPDYQVKNGSSLPQHDVELTPDHFPSYAQFSSPKTVGLDGKTIQPGEPEPQKSRWSLRNQLLLTLLPIVLLPLGIASVVGYRIIQEDAEEQIQRQMQDQALLAGEVTSELVEQYQTIPEIVAASPEVLEAVRAGNQQAIAANLAQLPIEQVEADFSETRLLTPNQTLNNYLENVAQIEGFAELFVTQRDGFNVGHSKPTEDFVQRDDEWWQEGKNQIQWSSNFARDESTGVLGVDLVQAIQDPNTGEFLGVIKALVSAERFEVIADYLEHAGISGSEQQQILDTSTSFVLQSITAEGVSDIEDVVGGDTLEAVSAALVRMVSEGVASEQAAEALENEYSLAELDVTSDLFEDEVRSLLASFVYEGRYYSLATIPDTDWVTIASIRHAEIEAAGSELVLVFALTALLLGGVATAIILYLARRLSAPLGKLANTAEQAASGNLDVRAESSGTSETQTLAQGFNNLLFQTKSLLQQQETENKQTRLLAEITGSRTTNQQEIDQTFVQALHNARKLLKVERMVIYRFNPDQSGYISHESVAKGLPVALNYEMGDPCIPKMLLEDYRNGRVVPTSDVYQTNYHPDHMKLLECLQIRANLVVPVLCQGQLFGLLVAHHCTTTHEWSEAEITFMKRLAEQLGVTLDRVTTVQEREAEAKRSGVLRDIALKLAAALNSKVIFNTAVQEIRQAMSSDRVVVYQFDSSWKGTVIAESVESGWPQALGAEIADPCFADKYVEKYKQGRVQATPDIYNAGLTECHLKQLEPFAVRANLVAPILVGGELLGLLIAHQCDQPRYWEQTEVDFFAQVATQVGLALDRANLLEQQKNTSEKLQKRALELLMQVDPVSQGDLTIRASVTEDEIGTIADSYNSTIESLRRIVSQVQNAAEQVADTTNTSEASVQSLSTEALRQTEEITAALDRIEHMTESIRAVSTNAQQAEAFVQQASQNVQAGDEAMNRTVEGILAIRETVSDTGEKVKQLGESTQKISKVVKLIGSFAAQTHLLALKASIEAARAGEEGQGFAVIADEVRSLAAQSAEATTEIEKMVGQIQAETSEVVAAMEAGTEQVASGTKLVEETRASLTQITAASAQINQLVEAIAAAAVEQTQSSEAVAITMADVAAIAQNTSSSAASVSDSFKELLATAQDLQADVAQFKV